ncbi:hypothetical protein [Jiangella alkaliphila]|uniref:Uncharacterized protein n=1 Tax=Jiangella alkaliphila TaxID=419479 RepID=A0A1H2IF40_9ACTN|nr:hypothetical protein [Jiangella alkaliphila]SDU42605.1 hypothetical protein SAMN04488563_1659 [Jiangella alkaliphila]
MNAWYCTRQDVMGALDVKVTARAERDVDRAAANAVGAVDALTRRRFHPWTGTRYFDWPSRDQPTPWRLWLGQNLLVTATTVHSAAVLLDPADYFLEPVNDGPPYDRLELNRANSVAFGGGPTYQRTVEIAGVWAGAPVVEVPIGVLAGALSPDPMASANITLTTPQVGVGDVLRIGSERVSVRELTMVDTGQDLATPLSASAAGTLVAVADGDAFAAGQTILLDAERMLVVDVAGNNLVVKRSWDGTVLAAHTGSSIFSRTGLDLVRGQLGTAAAAHDSGATIYRWEPPALINSLAIAESINQLRQENTGYTDTVDNQNEWNTSALHKLREDAAAEWGRRARTAAI